MRSIQREVPVQGVSLPFAGAIATVCWARRVKEIQFDTKSRERVIVSERDGIFRHIARPFVENE